MQDKLVFWFWKLMIISTHSRMVWKTKIIQRVTRADSKDLRMHNKHHIGFHSCQPKTAIWGYNQPQTHRNYSVGNVLSNLHLHSATRLSTDWITVLMHRFIGVSNKMDRKYTTELINIRNLRGMHSTCGFCQCPSDIQRTTGGCRCLKPSLHWYLIIELTW